MEVTSACLDVEVNCLAVGSNEAPVLAILCVAIGCGVGDVLPKRMVHHRELTEDERTT